MLGAADWMNRRHATLLAVDIPTGLMADTGSGMHVRATHTLSLLGLRPGLFTAQGRDAAGQVWLDNLGLELPAAHACAILAGPPRPAARPHASHKGSYGDVAVVGGAQGMAGAALLAASAALHAGAGRVYVGLLDPAAPGLDALQPELMFRAWESLDLGDMAVAAGCGGGDAIRAALPRIFSSAKSVVLDADALNAIAADPEVLQSGQGTRPLIITPHPGEMARLAHTSIDAVQANRVDVARDFAVANQVYVLLKGFRTVVATPDGKVFINPLGNPGMATGGTGDVLTGVLAAWLAQLLDAESACKLAVYLHALAGDLAEADEGEVAMTASDLVAHLGDAVLEITARRRVESSERT